MAPPHDIVEVARRIHAAITALDPDLAPPMPQDPGEEQVAALLGILTAHTDNILHSQSAERIPLVAAAYNHVLGNRGQSEHAPDTSPTSLTYERYAARLRMTGVALLDSAGRGPVTMMGGCLLAAYEGAKAGAAFAEIYAQPEEERGSTFGINERERLNKHLVAAQEHMATARDGIAMMAGYPDGEPDPEDMGTVLVSSDPRITRIIDLGGSAYIEYTFTTKDGPRSMAANMPLDGVAELVGLSAEERNTQVVKMIESSVDIVEAGGVGGPTG